MLSDTKLRFGLAVYLLVGPLTTPALSYTWPNQQTDFLEELYYQQLGYREHQFGVVVRSCNFNANLVGTGRQTTAEWLRTAYHDMATADIEAGTGGLDASISFELDRPENAGPQAFNDTIKTFLPFMTVRSSMADLIALGAVLSVTSCTIAIDHMPVYIPLRGGRIDASGAGPAGVPQPQEELDSHVASFARQGFNKSEMVALVACGHSIGGVHGKDFPEIVPVLNDTTNTESRQNFDDTVSDLENHIATSFLANSTQNALAFGPNETTRSDFRIFTSDGSDMIQRMAANNTFFLATCSSLLERMLNTVPKDVQLSDIIAPVTLKPNALEIVVDAASGNLTLTGELRLQYDFLPHNNRSILLHLSDGNGSNATYAPVVAEKWGPDATGLFPYAPSFQWWLISASVPATQGLSSFTVEIVDTDNTTVYANGGGGFPLQTEIIPQIGLSCASTSRYFLNVTAAVLDSADFTSVELSVPIPIAQAGSVVPRFETTNVPMNKVQELEGTGYSLYNGVLDTNIHFLSTIQIKSYDVVGTKDDQIIEVPFRLWSALSSC